ncbi:MAG TPA: FGGY-family carbohydrate kinase [Acidobacteriaceae bacterium]|nr:FGGY-family carbohydrate kinase [Acidobacteriaceae bacterium]
MTRPALVAIDLGAESCRVSLLRWTAGSSGAPENPAVSIVHRFANAPWSPDASDPHASGVRWNLDRMCQELDRGLRACAEKAPEGIASIGVTGWAVDYVRLDEAGRPIAPPFCYRDPRTNAAFEAVHRIIPADQLYARTGVQIQPINTIYQLYADKLAGVSVSTPWINLPESILHWLGAPRVAEITNATHTALIDPVTRSWSDDLFAALGLDRSAAPPLVQPGTALGLIRPDLRSLPALAQTQLIAPACHDTASAIAGIAVAGSAPWAYISSGTWSLIGMVLPEPCRTPEAYAAGFTHLGAADGGILFHRGLAGMWLLRQCLVYWEDHRGWSLPELIAETRCLPPPDALLDLDDPAFLPPGDMPARINAQRRRHGLPPLSDGCDAAPDYANLIFHSLAHRYASLLDDIARITGHRAERICIVGGGSRNDYLNDLTAQAAKIPVERHAVESSTLGNFAVQLARLHSLSGSQTTDGVSALAVAEQAHRLANASLPS